MNEDDDSRSVALLEQEFERDGDIAIERSGRLARPARPVETRLQPTSRPICAACRGV
jgi:hypothetical protein